MNSTTQPEQIRFGMIVMPDKLASAFALERTRMIGQITGSLASVLVEQHFRNDLDAPVEIEYLFPLPEKAAVFGFELRVGERIIRGEIQETQQAYERYEEARRSGQQAALVEQRRRNLFAVRVANVLPGKPVSSVLRYTEPLRYMDGEWEFVFPMGLTPRYNAPSHKEEAAGVNFPVANPGEAVGTIEISLAVQCATGCAQPTSPSHSLAITRLDEHRFEVSLAQPAIPDHDLVLRLPLHTGEPASLDGYLYQAGKDTFFQVNLLPDRRGDELKSRPREFVFVLDRSGSMMGEPIAQARNALRACLRALDAQDTFRILLFDNEIEWYQPEAARITQTEVDAADNFLASIEGRGGTEITAALQAALSLPTDIERPRYIVFLTDGAVSAEERALDKVRKLIGKTRLFTFGIGPSVNRALLRAMAELGHGTAEFLQLNEDIEGAIIRFQDRVSYPALTDLALQFPGVGVTDVYPKHLSDLYYGDAISVTGRIEGTPGVPPVAQLTGVAEGQRYTAEAHLLPVNEPAVARAWAQAQIDHLAEQSEAGKESQKSSRKDILALALRFGLLSEFTSFVAVDDEVVARGGSPLVVAVAQPLPQGLARGGFGGPMPPMPFAQTAMFSMSAPAFLRDATSAPSARRGMRKAMPETYISEAEQLPEKPEALLRQLARMQKIDGSWNDDVEWTSAALLAFFRHGHSTRSGSYRRQMRNALAWLTAATASGPTARLRDSVLAQVSAQAQHATVPQTHAPATVTTLGALRNAALENHPVEIAPTLLAGNEGELARLWQACITAR